jgi:hypothetical protein
VGLNRCTTLKSSLFKLLPNSLSSLSLPYTFCSLHQFLYFPESTADCSPNDSSLFDSENVERLWEWQKCLAFCIEERLEKEERTTKSSELEDLEREGEGELWVQEPGLNRRGEGLKTVLPFSPGNLTGFLTKNHQLTQKYTEYPEPKQREPQTGKSHGEPTTFANTC